MLAYFPSQHETDIVGDCFAHANHNSDEAHLCVAHLNSSLNCSIVCSLSAVKVIHWCICSPGRSVAIRPSMHRNCTFHTQLRPLVPISMRNPNPTFISGYSCSGCKSSDCCKSSHCTQSRCCFVRSRCFSSQKKMPGVARAALHVTAPTGVLVSLTTPCGFHSR